MSNITDVVLNLGSDDAAKVEEINAFLERSERTGFVPIAEETFPLSRLAGGKGFGGGLFVGGFNYLDITGLVWFLSRMAFEEPECVQLFVQEEGDYCFRVINLFPEAQVLRDHEEELPSLPELFGSDFVSFVTPECWHNSSVRVTPNAAGWVICPGCGNTFAVNDKRAFDHSRHTCGQMIATE